MTFTANSSSCVSSKHEDSRFSTSLTLLRSYSVYLGNRQRRSSTTFLRVLEKRKFHLAVCRERHA